MSTTMSTEELHAVVGGTGRAGAATVRALLGRGRRVRIVNTSGRGLPGAETRTEAVAADLLDAASTRAALAGAAVVYDCSNPPVYTAQAWADQFPLMSRHVAAGPRRPVPAWSRRTTCTCTARPTDR